MTTFKSGDESDDFARVVKRGQSVLEAGIVITPPHITPPIRSFCQGLSSGRPFVMHRETTREVVARFSSDAIARRVRSKGGSLLKGWKIKCVPGLWATAEFHAVWVSEDNLLLDITSHDDDEDTVLFLPDPDRGAAIPDCSVGPPTLHERLLTDPSEIDIVQAFIASLEPHVRSEAERIARSKGLTLTQAVRPPLNFRGAITRQIDEYLEEAGALAAMLVPAPEGIASDPSKRVEYDERLAKATRARREILDWAKTQLRQCLDTP